MKYREGKIKQNEQSPEGGALCSLFPLNFLSRTAETERAAKILRGGGGDTSEI